MMLALNLRSALVGVALCITTGSAVLAGAPSVVIGRPAERADCGAVSVMTLCWLLDRGLDGEEEQRIRQECGSGASLHDLRAATARLGIDAVGVKGSPDEILGFGGPTIVHLDSPAHFTVLLDVVGAVARLMEGRRVYVVDSAWLASRMSGYALLLARGPKDIPAACVVDPAHLQLGQAALGATVEGRFRIKNLGTGPLEIRVESVSCTCTEVSPAEQVIVPGAEGWVNAALHVTAPAANTATILVRSSDPQRPRLVLSIQAEAPSEWKASLQRVDLVADKGAIRTISLSIVAPTDSRVAVVECDLAFVEISSLQRGLDERESGVWRYEVSLRSDSPVGAASGHLAVLREGDNATVISIPVEVLVRGDLEVRPGAVLISAAADRGRVIRSIVISSRRAQPFEVTSVTSAQSLVVIHRVTRTAPHRWEVQVAYTPKQDDDIRDKVLVETDVAGEARVEVPIVASATP